MGGSWINRDPIAENGGLNLYGFVGNKVWVWDIAGTSFKVYPIPIYILPMQSIADQFRVVAFTGDPTVNSVASPRIKGSDIIVVSEKEGACCAKATKAKKLEINVVTYIPYPNDVAYFHTFIKSGYTAMLGHENRRREVYELANDHYLEPSELSGSFVSGCEICRDNKKDAGKAMIQYFNKLRAAAINNYMTYIIQEQFHIGDKEDNRGYTLFDYIRGGYVFHQWGYSAIHIINTPSGNQWVPKCQ